MSYLPKLNESIILFESFCKKSQIDGKEIEATIGDTAVKLKVASTQESQAKGFMNGEEPSNNTGIIFVYDSPKILNFWMKNVGFDLDIIFFDDNGDYISHETMKKYNGENDSELPRYTCNKKARYAVELKSGWFKKYGSDNCKLSF